MQRSTNRSTMKNHRDMVAASLLPVLGAGVLQRSDAVVVAVSGGADSVCLLYIMHALRRRFGLKLHVAHLNHGLRGDEAEAALRYVKRLATRLGLPVTARRHDVAKYRQENRLSVEEAAREVRYRFLAGVAHDIGARVVMLGHIADDNVETVLMNLIRGSGTRGISGLRPVNKLPYGEPRMVAVRPLLELTRADTEAYCREMGLRPHKDSSNDSPIYLRNRIRGELLPLMAGYNPNIKNAILRVAKLAEDEHSFLLSEAAAAFEDIVDKRGGGYYLNRAQYSLLPKALKNQLIRFIFLAAAGNQKNLSAAHAEDMFGLTAGPPGRSLDLPQSQVFITGYKEHYLGLKKDFEIPLPPLGFPCNIQIPGVTEYCGWKITAELLKQGPCVVAVDEYTVFIDWGRVKAPVQIRKRAAGDVFQPLGMAGEKKLSRFMIDEKIPRTMRDRVPVICAGSEIIWVAGYRLSETVKVTEKTRNILKLTMMPGGQ
ncbi:tRNA lysidine(34) synthetase TilS [Chloroflexota bacterium]